MHLGGAGSSVQVLNGADGSHSLHGPNPDSPPRNPKRLDRRLEQEQQAALSLQRLLEERDERVRVLEDERGTEAKAQAQQLASAKERY